MQNIQIWTGEMTGYQLLDSGEKEKLEEINGLPAQTGTKIVRKEPRAWWKKTVDSSQYQVAREKQKELDTILGIGIGEIKAKVRFKESSKHIGIFPEQFPQWEWIWNRISKLESRGSNKQIHVLNLFGYTGIASLVAAQAGLSREAGTAKWGAKVTHVDASKQSIEWARENQKLSGLENAPIRWITDDAVKFLKREARRMKESSDRSGYDAIIMDPPSYGRGPKGEVWKIEDELGKLLAACREVLSDDPLFVIFNMYSTELSSISVANLLADMMKGLNGSIESGELDIKHENSKKLLPMSIFAIWER
jgi:23S rRNA (cytosine1962-C5)-methyltransferase